MIDPKSLWCDGWYKKDTPKKIIFERCPDLKRDRCPCFCLNKTHQDNIAPFRLIIHWRNKRKFQYCQNYKLR